MGFMSANTRHASRRGDRQRRQRASPEVNSVRAGVQDLQIRDNESCVHELIYYQECGHRWGRFTHASNCMGNDKFCGNAIMDSILRPDVCHGPRGMRHIWYEENDLPCANVKFKRRKTGNSRGMCKRCWDKRAAGQPHSMSREDIKLRKMVWDLFVEPQHPDQIDRRRLDRQQAIQEALQICKVSFEAQYGNELVWHNLNVDDPLPADRVADIFKSVEPANIPAGDECCQCLDDMSEVIPGQEKKICQLPCGHNIHNDCINEWFNTIKPDGGAKFDTCPMCQKRYFWHKQPQISLDDQIWQYCEYVNHIVILRHGYVAWDNPAQPYQPERWLIIDLREAVRLFGPLDPTINIMASAGPAEADWYIRLQLIGTGKNDWLAPNARYRPGEEIEPPVGNLHWPNPIQIILRFAPEVNE